VTPASAGRLPPCLEIGLLLIKVMVRKRRAQEASALPPQPRSQALEAERKAIADAQKIVAIWNARQAGGRAPWFYPAVGAAIASRSRFPSRSDGLWALAGRRARRISFYHAS
jgi:hypothetical protein